MRGAPDAEVEEDGGGDDGDGVAAERDADLSFGQFIHHPSGGGEAERGAAGENDRMYLLDGVFRPKEVGFSCAWSRATDIDAADGARGTEYDGAASGGAAVGPMTDANPRYVRDRVVEGHPGGGEAA
jgi:hypothetical protein